MNIKDFMSRDLIVCSIDETIYDIAETMKKNDIGFVPLSKDKKIVGVITDRDIVCRVISNNISLDASIENYITSNVISIDLNSSLDSAIELMGNEKVKRLIVTDQNKVVGIISLSNILSSNIDHEIVFNNLKKIWSIRRNTDDTSPEVDEFYL